MSEGRHSCRNMTGITRKLWKILELESLFMVYCGRFGSQAGWGVAQACRMG